MRGESISGRVKALKWQTGPKPEQIWTRNILGTERRSAWLDMVCKEEYGLKEVLSGRPVKA